MCQPESKGSVAVPQNKSQVRPSGVRGGRRYVSVDDVAEYLGVTDRTVRNMIYDGRLTGYRGLGARVLRIDLNQVDAMMESTSK
jgi:excisionase family DNA binding protein